MASMNLDSVRNLKASLSETHPMTLALPARKAAPLGIPAGRTKDVERVQPGIALGVAPGAVEGDYRLAVRVQHQRLARSDHVAQLISAARGEADVRFIGRVTKRDAWNEDRHRPLRPGISVGHFRITAGTIGSFVSRGQSVFILSNNHVLADENQGRRGDEILQPGTYDKGRRPRDVVGALQKFVRLVSGSANAMDCAIASLNQDVEYDPRLPRARRHLSTDVAAPEDASRVEKVGRTTGHTRGRVAAFEVDGVVVEYDIGNLRFDDQIEIAGTRQPFSAGGDSGSLIYTSGDRRPYALLFAGSDAGGPAGMGVTYANPLEPVLRELRVDLLT